MKQLFASIILGLTLLTAFAPTVVLAQGNECDDNSASSGELCNALPILGSFRINNIQDLVQAVLVWGGSVLATGALIMIIYSGVRMIISQGDAQAVTSAKSAMYYSIIGFVISILAYVIVSSIEYFLGAKPDSNASFFINPLNSDSLESLVSRTISGVLALAGLIAMTYLVIGGFRYITGGANEEQVKKGKNTVVWAIIGLMSIILSYTIIQVVTRTLTNTP